MDNPDECQYVHRALLQEDSCLRDHHYLLFTEIEDCCFLLTGLKYFVDKISEDNDEIEYWPHTQQTVVIEGATAQKVDNIFYIQDDTECEKLFRGLCQIYQNVHWFSEDDRKLIWRRSQCEDETVLEDFLTKNVKVSEDFDLLPFRNRLVVIDGKNGEGKTTFFNFIKKQILKSNSETVIFDFNILDYLELFVVGFNEEDIIRIFAAVYKHLDASVITTSLKTAANVVVLIDDVDLIPERFRYNFWDFVSILLSYTKATVLMGKIRFNVRFPCISFKPLDQFKMAEYFRGFWANFTNIETTDIKVIGLKTYQPLVLKMISELYNPSDKIDLDLVTLYKKYIEKKLNNPLEMKTYEKAALHYYGVYKTGAKLDLEQNFLIANKTTYRFFNKSIADYLCANWILTNRINMIHFLENLFFTNDYEGIRFYFNLKTANNQLQVGIITNNIKMVKDNMIDVGTTDEIGRNALHLAAISGNTEMLNLINKNKTVNLEVKDGLLGWYPLQYAEKMQHWSIVDKLMLPTSELLSVRNILKRNKYGILCFLHEIIVKDCCNLLDYVLNIKTNLLDFSFEYFYKHLRVKRTFVSGVYDYNKPIMADMAAAVGATKVLEGILSKYNKDELTMSKSLNFAAGNDRLECVKLLVTKGANLNLDAKLYSPLHVATCFGNVEVVRTLLELGADLNSNQGKAKETPIEIAIRQNNVELVELFLEKGAKLTDVSLLHNTPLSSAAELKRHFIMEMIFRRMDITEDFETMLPILLPALYCNWLGLDDIKMELINKQDVLGNTLLHYLAILKYYEELEVPLFSHFPGINPNLKNELSRTPLHYASQNNRVGLVKLLIQNGADCKMVDSLGLTPFMLAVETKTSEAADVLFDLSDTEAKENEGFTAFHYSACHDNVNILSKMVRNGFDVNLTTDCDDTALSLASVNGSKEAVIFLLENGASVRHVGEVRMTPLHLAALKNHLYIAKLLIEAGAEIDAVDEENETPFQLGINEDASLEFVQYLFEKGASVNHSNNSGLTPLHFAAIRNNHQIIKFLIQNGGKVNEIDDKKQTPLMSAILKNSFSAIQVLLDCEFILLDVCDKAGNTALHLAAGADDLFAVKKLLEKGANTKILNNKKENFVNVAENKNCFRVLKFLSNF